MLPVLLIFGPVVLTSYMVCLLVALIMGLFAVWRRGRDLHFDEEILFDSLLRIIVWVLMGARLGYILWHFGTFGWNLFRWINLIGVPGGWLIGGLITGAIGVVQEAKRNKWDAFTLGDVLIPSLVLMQAIMAIGNFLNGNGAGVITNSFLGVRFAGMYDKRLPIQLWESLALVGVFAYVWWAEGAYRTFSWYKGQRSEANSGYIVAVYLLFWGLIELVIAFFRPPGITLLGLPVEILISGLIGLGGAILLLQRAGTSPGRLWTQWLEKRRIKSSRSHRPGAPYQWGNDIFD